MSKPRGRRFRGIPADWNELKKLRSLLLTDTAWQILKDKGDEMDGVGRSEVIERLARLSVEDEIVALKLAEYLQDQENE